VARHQDIPAAIDAAAKFAKVQKSDVHVDKSLIGGWRLEHQDMLVDTSYKQQLLDIFNRVTA
jgi:F0F1-type ATP synthase delta subunit